MKATANSLEKCEPTGPKRLPKEIGATKVKGPKFQMITKTEKWVDSLAVFAKIILLSVFLKILSSKFESFGWLSSANEIAFKWENSLPSEQSSVIPDLGVVGLGVVDQAAATTSYM
ncbi:hypothetical protein TNCV_2646761 [Trichonephila clavipes]|nr:hypothetical protein TNCV_2646761 [Trichonephila clavipes]